MINIYKHPILKKIGYVEDFLTDYEDSLLHFKEELKRLTEEKLKINQDHPSMIAPRSLDKINNE